MRFSPSLGGFIYDWCYITERFIYTTTTTTTMRDQPTTGTTTPAQAEKLLFDCVKCKYQWEPRKEEPKACPRCKTRLDQGVNA